MVDRKQYSKRCVVPHPSFFSQTTQICCSFVGVFVFCLVVEFSLNIALAQTVHSISAEASSCLEAKAAAVRPALLQEMPVVAQKFNLPALSTRARELVLAQGATLYATVGKKGLKVKEKRSSCRVKGKVQIGHASLRTAMERAICDTLVAEQGKKYVAVLVRFEQNASPGDPVDSKYSDFQTIGSELSRKFASKLNKCNVQVVDEYQYFPNTANVLGATEFKQIATSRGGLLSQMYTMAKEEYGYTLLANSHWPTIEEVLLGAVIVRNKGYNEIENRFEAEGTSDFGIRQLLGVDRFSFEPLTKLGFGDTPQEAARQAARLIVEKIFDDYSERLTKRH